MDPFLSQIAVTAITSAVSIAVGWAMGGIKGAAKERAQAKAESDKAREETRKEAAKDRETTRQILKTLLYCRLADMHRRYVVDGAPCTPADKQEAEGVFREYHDVLGGNGSGTALYKEIMAAHVA